MRTIAKICAAAFALGGALVISAVPAMAEVDFSVGFGDPFYDGYYDYEAPCWQYEYWDLPAPLRCYSYFDDYWGPSLFIDGDFLFPSRDDWQRWDDGGGWHHDGGHVGWGGDGWHGDGGHAGWDNGGFGDHALGGDGGFINRDHGGHAEIGHDGGDHIRTGDNNAFRGFGGDHGFRRFGGDHGFRSFGGDHGFRSFGGDHGFGGFGGHGFADMGGGGDHDGGHDGH